MGSKDFDTAPFPSCSAMVDWTLGHFCLKRCAVLISRGLRGHCRRKALSLGSCFLFLPQEGQAVDWEVTVEGTSQSLANLLQSL